ncbi:MAG: TonB-dependent receptor [Taibaiella sp.]|nr:TonB-dependent receptor [Taibaiella sp.]
MLQLRLLLFAVMLFFSYIAAAQPAVVDGFVRDDSGRVMELVAVVDMETMIGGHTNAKGYYMIEIPTGRNITVAYYAPGFDIVKRSLNLAKGDVRSLNIKLKRRENVGKEVVVTDKQRNVAGNVRVELSKANFIPDISGGVEGLIKLLVGSHNELTSQYSVRGGNYDENLVYVNDFEIYRPFLVRTGQQEGLSFVNSDLTQNVNFSVGGFQAKYGDKMSSVLDVTYKKPKRFAGSVMASLLGANLHLEGISKNKKLTYLFGARQKTNQYVLQSQPTKGIYNPSFTDIQALVNYKINDNWELEAIGNYARNRFTFFPETRVSSFGVLNQAYQLDVYYDGGEFDQFDSRFGGVSASYHRDSSRLRLKFLASGFQTNEYETYDIGGEYLFGELQTDQSKKDFGQIKTYLGTGFIQNFARNYLNVSVGDIAMRGAYDANKNFLQFGLNAVTTSIQDELHEWERRDSARYNQPYDPNNLALAYFYHSTASFNYMRLNGFFQDNIRFDSAGRLNASLGVRFNYSFLNKEFLISPRLQLSYKPKGKRDVIFKFSTGLYQQPPFYREMRDLNGGVNKELRAQKSLQVVGGVDYSFNMYHRDFRLTAEMYFKNLWDLDPYFYDNVRIRYTGKNDAIGRIYGGEVRLYGDLVKDATSWISIGLLKGEQKITDSPSIPGYDSYFPLPSDQRFMLGMYFEDYLRHNKNFKAHINMMYATGLPVGPPTGHLYQNTLRLPDYKRVDIGFSALLLDAERHEHPSHSYFNLLHSIWASLEVFNLLSIQNTLSYTWIQDNSTNKRYAVPNRLTSRLLNVKVIVNF